MGRHDGIYHDGHGHRQRHTVGEKRCSRVVSTSEGYTDVILGGFSFLGDSFSDALAARERRLGGRL